MEDWSGLGDGAQRNDFHEVLVVLGGRGVVRQDEAEARLRPPCILFTAPGQVRRLKLTKALRGPVILWAQDAVDRVDKFLDEAFLAGVESVRIIHGHGKGILRKAIAELLTGHLQVERFKLAPQDQGGTGATIVEMRK